MILSWRNETVNPGKALCNSVQRSFMCNRPKLETAQMPFHRGMNCDVFM